MTACANCQQSTARPHWGGYSTLVRSLLRAVDSFGQADAARKRRCRALELRQPLTPTKARVLRALRLLDARIATGKPRRCQASDAGLVNMEISIKIETSVACVRCWTS